MPDQLDLRYDLFALPTALHRAGLAGLLIVLDTMRRRGLAPLANLSQPEAGLVALSLSERALGLLLDYFYDATTEERALETRRKDRSGDVIEPLRTETRTVTDKRTGKQKTKIVYIYHQVVPKGPFLQALDMPESWLKLWTEAVWQGIRAVPKTRGPYEQRAHGASVGETRQLWADLQKAHRLRAAGEQHATKVVGTLLLGAQETNADDVPFLGAPAENLLLHFWPVVMGIGEAWRVKIEDGQVHEEPSAYVLTVPDVADLDGFVEDFPAFIHELGTDMAGYRPRDAVLALRPEGGLQFLRHTADLANARAGSSALRYSVSGVQVFELVRRGKAVHVAGSDRLPAKRELIERYDAIVGTSFNLVFRAQLLRNLLADVPWFTEFNHLFDTYPWELFLGGNTKFPLDVGRKLQLETSQTGIGETMTDGGGQPEFDITRRVRDIVAAYVRHRTEDRSGVKWKDIPFVKDPTTGKNRRDVPEKYRDAQEKVCREAFLAMRSRRSREDFVDYFVGTVCAVPQFLPAEDFRELSAALLWSQTRWEDVKALAMLTVSSMTRV